MGAPATRQCRSTHTGEYGIRKGIKECYIDCIPALLPYYKALGFAIAGPKFFHRENGPSHPMRIDLVKHGEAPSNEGGMCEYSSLVVKAQVIRLIDGARGYATWQPRCE